MQYKEQTISCPKCKKNIKIRMLEQIDQSKFDDVISRKIFKFKCVYCKNEVIIDYPTTFIGENFEVCYKMTKKKSDKLYLRECYDFDDFKEKLLIFSANLNDIAIEFIKDYLRRAINEKNIDIRFDSKDEENIIFYMMEKNEYIGFKIEQYFQLLSHTKIKNIKKFKEINHTNYLKYIKVSI